MSKTFAEQVAALKATRDAKHEEMKGVAQKSIDESRSMDTAESEQFDTLKSEIKRLDDDISRLSILADMDKATAKPVDGETKANQPAQGGTDAGRLPVQVKSADDAKDGIGFARFVLANSIAMKGLCNGLRDPAAVAKHLWANDVRLQQTLKAAAAATTSTPTWAGNTILDGGAYFADFVAYAAERSLVGQIWDRLQTIPANTNVLIEGNGDNLTTGTAELNAKPVISGSLTKAKFDTSKFAGIVVVSDEMMRKASYDVATYVRDFLVRKINQAIDTRFASASTGSNMPDGMMYGVSPTSLDGDGTVFGIRCDISAMLKALVATQKTVGNSFWVMSEATAIDLTFATNEVGAPAFPGMSVSGGTLGGLPVFVSGYMSDDGNGPRVALIKGEEIYKLDEGGIEISTNDQGVIQIDSETSVNLWQDNAVATRAERFLGWAKRRSGSVVWANVNWNSCEGLSS